jgi:transposase InsO family protein
MRIGEEMRRKVVELDRRYRSTWDARTIAHVLGLGKTTVAKILREFRGPRPKRRKAPHTRRTRFLRRDVMWSSDFMRLGWGWLLLTTIDEMSGCVLGWTLVRSENAAEAIEHALSIIARLGRAPLVWKYDHGSAFMSAIFQGLLAARKILPYPIAPRSPWVNGRKERHHQEVHQWLIPLAGAELSRLEIENEIDEDVMVRNYVKPRACLGFRRSAEVYHDEAAAIDAKDDVRGRLAQAVIDEKAALGAEDPEEVYAITGSGERKQRRAIRNALEKLGLYEEWDTAPLGPSETRTVNRSELSNVSI